MAHPSTTLPASHSSYPNPFQASHIMISNVSKRFRWAVLVVGFVSGTSGKQWLVGNAPFCAFQTLPGAKQNLHICHIAVLSVRKQPHVYFAITFICFLSVAIQNLNIIEMRIETMQLDKNYTQQFHFIESCSKELSSVPNIHIDDRRGSSTCENFQIENRHQFETCIKTFSKKTAKNAL